MRASDATRSGPASDGPPSDRLTTQPASPGVEASAADAESHTASSCCPAVGSGATGPADVPPGLTQRLLVGCIHVYQAARSGRPSPCRFLPSCSAYGEEAIVVHGPVRGCVLTLKRIARCRPGGGSGVDLVPPRS